LGYKAWVQVAKKRDEAVPHLAFLKSWGLEQTKAAFYWKAA